MDAVATTKGFAKLSTASQAIADLEDSIQSEIRKQQALTTATASTVCPMPSTVTSDDVQPMATELTPQATGPSAGAPLKVQHLDITNETGELLHVECLDDFQLGEPRGESSVVGKVVVALGHAIEFDGMIVHSEASGEDAAEVRLNREEQQVKH